MNRETAKKLLPNTDMIAVFASGGHIQEMTPSGWMDVTDPYFDRPPGCYRIKPREPREFNACLNKFGELVNDSYGKNDPGYTAIRVREILTDETP